MKEPPQIQVVGAKGLNTYAARGSTDAPHVLRNAVLRPGGWACAPKAQTQMAGMLGAAYAGQKSDLFVQTATGLSYYTPDAVTPIPDTAALTLTAATTLGPGLLFVADQYVHPAFGARPVLKGATFVEWDGTGTPPAGPWWHRKPALIGQIPFTTFANNASYTVRLEPVRGPDAVVGSSYTGVTTLTLPATAGSDRYLLEFGNVDWGVNIYHDGFLSVGTRPAKPVFIYTNVNLVSGTIFETFVLGTSQSPIATSVALIRPRVAEYHQARVWATGPAWFYDPENHSEPDAQERGSSRLYFSDVLLSFGDKALPFFAEDYYFDIPFKVSREIVALQSAGRYLYIFGDREVLLLSGSDDNSWSIESVGDSIGAVAAQSVQRLQNAAIYLSDSGVLLLSGGQAQDVSGDVRDLLLALNRETLSSTVDFTTEQYLISDGVTTLVFHLREQGWTTRAPDGTDQRLLTGGGTPYSVHSGVVATLDSPELLTMTVTLGPFGRPGSRRTWRGVTGAVDSDAPAVLSAVLTGFDWDMDFAPVTVPGAAQTRPVAAGLTPVVLSLGNADGVTLTSALIELTVTLTPDATTRRCLLRPPLEVVGRGETEAWA